jgi:hypothetical protein
MYFIVLWSSNLKWRKHFLFDWVYLLQIKTKIVSFHAADFKPVKQEVNRTVILPSLVFPGWGIENVNKQSYFPANTQDRHRRASWPTFGPTVLVSLTRRFTANPSTKTTDTEWKTSSVKRRRPSSVSSTRVSFIILHFCLRPTNIQLIFSKLNLYFQSQL